MLANGFFLSCSSDSSDDDYSPSNSNPSPAKDDNENENTDSGNPDNTGNTGNTDNTGDTGNNSNTGNTDNTGNAGNNGNSGNTDNTGNPGSGNPSASGILPIIPAGNNKTKIEGAGIWIYLDNTSLGISGGNSSDIAANTKVTVTDTSDSSQVDYQSFQFDDYGAEEKTVRFMVNMPDAARTSVKVDITVNVNGRAYKGEAVFKNGVYQFDFTPAALVIAPATKTVETGSEVTFTVKDSVYGIDITDKCTFTADGATVNGNKVTVSNNTGNVTVTVSYDDDSLSTTATLTVVEAGSVSYDIVPVIVDDTSITGNQLFLYLDNSVIGMVAGNNKYEDEMTFVFTDTNSNAVFAVTPQEYNAWEGNKFRLYATLPEGGHDNATLKITATFGDKSYQSTVTFTNGKAASNN